MTLTRVRRTPARCVIGGGIAIVTVSAMTMYADEGTAVAQYLVVVEVVATLLAVILA